MNLQTIKNGKVAMKGVAMKGLVHKVYCEMYKTHIYVYFNKETYCRKNGYDLNDDFAGEVAYKHSDGTMHVFVEEENNKLNITTLCHESYHVADFIFDKCGIEYKKGSGNEQMAYLIGWVSSKILDCFNKELTHNSKVL